MVTSTRVRHLLFVASLALAACSGSATPAPSAAGPAATVALASPSVAQSPVATTAGGSSPGSGGGSAGTPSPAAGKGVVTGTIVTSGVYSANWTVYVGNNSASHTGRFGLTSDKGATPADGLEANIAVDGRSGSITFDSVSSGRDGIEPPADFAAGGPYVGAGGRSVIRTDPNGNDYTCAITVDADLTGGNGTVLHVKGTLTIQGTFLTTGGFTIDC